LVVVVVVVVVVVLGAWCLVLGLSCVCNYRDLINQFEMAIRWQLVFREQSSSEEDLLVLPKFLRRRRLGLLSLGAGCAKLASSGGYGGEDNHVESR
jgi:hypothetical protein